VGSGDDGQDESVSAQIAALQPRLYRFACALTHSPQEAADLTQEASLRALTAANSYAPGTNLRAWLFTILRNVHLNRRRDARLRPTIAIDELATDAGPMDRPLRPVEQEVLLRADVNQLREAFQGLPAVFREPLYLTVIQELSYAQVAERLDIPVGTVMSRVYRARRLLLARLGERAHE
jgi:RNA polymerase sigma-70 factor (ECF subfamily)